MLPLLINWLQFSSNVGTKHVDDVGNIVSPSDVLGSNPLSSPNEIVDDLVVGPLKETQTHTNVAPNVTTFLVQPTHPNEIILETFGKSDNESDPSESSNKYDD
jgi:hypothetical protein